MPYRSRHGSADGRCRPRPLLRNPASSGWDGRHAGGRVAVWRIAAGFLFGLGSGFISSLLRVAGGAVIIPTLVLGFGVAIKVAGSQSLLVSLPTVAVELVRYAGQRLLQGKAVVRGIIAPGALGSVGGVLLGGLLVGLIPAGVLKLGLGVVLI